MGQVNVNNSGLPTGDMDTTPTALDVTFFQELLTPTPPAGITRIPADPNMAHDTEMRGIMDRFIKYPMRFSQVFGMAYVKLLNLGATFLPNSIPGAGQVPPLGQISLGSFVTTLSFSMSTPTLSWPGPTP